MSKNEIGIIPPIQKDLEPLRPLEVETLLVKMGNDEKEFIFEKKEEIKTSELLIAEFTYLLSEYSHVRKGQMTWCYHQALNHAYGIPDEEKFKRAK